MKNLINDLNLSSKLQYHMQPLRIETLNLVAVVRQVVVDFLNLDLEGKIPHRVGDSGGFAGVLYAGK